jgi:restriction endonuclease S subunit
VSYTTDPSQVLFITSENVRENRIDVSDPKFVELKFNELQPNSIFEDGDVLINIVGASIGRAAVFEGSQLANTNQAVAVVRVPFPHLRKFIAHLLNTRFIYNYLVNQSVDVARANVSLVDVANIPVPICSSDEIAMILTKIDSSLSTLDALEADIDLNLQKAEALRQSILKKAFAGELVPQDPADEPAAALLARIRAEREAKAASSQKKEPSRRPKRAS